MGAVAMQGLTVYWCVMKFRFVSPPGYEPPAVGGFEHGYDFSGGAVVDVQEPGVIAKLLGNRFFERVDAEEPKPRRRRRRSLQLEQCLDAEVADSGDDNEARTAQPSAD